MNEFPVQSLAEIISADTNNKMTQDSFIGVSTDTRTTKPGECFFAIKGDCLDGADYLDDALSEGAICAIVNEDVDTSSFPADKILKVKDSLEALGDFAHWYRNENGFNVIAITGSVGKTTTRNIIHNILSKKFRTYQAPKNYNTLTGLPLSILDAAPEDDILILELGTNRPGEIGALSKIASPDIALITTVQPSHLEGFGSLDNITEEKVSIVSDLKDDAPLIINADCPVLLAKCQEKGLKFYTFGKSDNADFYAEDIKLGETFSTFEINKTALYLPIPGLGAVENTIAAWAVCSQLAITIEEFADALKTITTVPMRTQIEKAGNLTIINDCYNANPASMKNALDILCNFKRADNQRLIFICGDMAELGGQSEKLHTELGEVIADAGLDLMVAVGPLAKIAAEKAAALSNQNMQTKYFPDSAAACNNLTNYINPDDIILIKGSRVAKLELVAKQIKSVFETQKR